MTFLFLSLPLSSHKILVYVEHSNYDSLDKCDTMQGDRTKKVGVVDSEYIVHKGIQTLGGHGAPAKKVIGISFFFPKKKKPA